MTDPAGDVTARARLATGSPLATGSSVALPPGVCYDGRVDITSFDVASDDEHIAFIVTFADGDDEPTCETPAGTIALQGPRWSFAQLGWWGDPAWLAIRPWGSGCEAYGEMASPDPDFSTYWFETSCEQIETAGDVTFRLGTFATIIYPDDQPPLDLRTLTYGPGYAFANSATSATGGALRVDFHDSIPIDDLF